MRLSLQSTSDQTDYLYNANIAANVASAVTPEQGGMWVYPYEDEEEHVIYNVVNGMLLRPYISGMVWKLGENSMNRMKEGIALYKEIREEVRDGVPFFPLGGFTPLQSSTLSDVAASLGATPMQVALAWLLQRSPNILLIPGTSSVAHLRENMAAEKLHLSEEVLSTLDGISRE